MKLTSYKLNLKDIDQMDTASLDSYLAYLERSFLYNINIDENIFYKTIHYDNSIYIQTNRCDLELSEVTLVKNNENPLERFFFNDYEKNVSNVLIGEDYFTFNLKYYRLINVLKFSSSISTASLQDIGTQITNFVLIPRSKSKKMLDLQRRLHQANNAGLMVNYDSEKSQDQSEAILSLVTENEECLVFCECWILIDATDKKELDKKTSEAIRQLNIRDFDCFIEDIAQNTIVSNFLDAKPPLLKRKRLLTGTYLINCLPLRYDYLHKEGIQFYSRRLKEVYLDTFNQQSNSFNYLISGFAGSGKSALAQKIIYDNLKLGHASIILDKGGSYRKIVNYFGGNNFETKFNPMQFPNPNFLKEFILSCIPDSEITYKDVGRIGKKIGEFLKERKKATFKELLEYLNEHFHEIEYYFEDLLPYISDEDVKINKITLVDMDFYPNYVLRPLIIYLVEYFKNVSGRRLFVFDECWSLLNKRTEYLNESFRTFRKFGASAIAITQSLNDFLSTDIGLAMAQNSFYKIIFKQNIKVNEYINETDLEKISSLNTIKGMYSEFYLKTEFNNKILRYYQDSFEYELFTSNYEDNQKIRGYFKDKGPYLDFKDIFNSWVRLKYDL